MLPISVEKKNYMVWDGSEAVFTILLESKYAETCYSIFHEMGYRSTEIIIVFTHSSQKWSIDGKEPFSADRYT